MRTILRKIKIKNVLIFYFAEGWIISNDKKSGCVEPKCYSATLKGKRTWFKLPIGTVALWMRCNPKTKVTEYKVVKIIDDLKGDFLVGDYALVKCDTELCTVSYGWLFKIYTS